MKTNKRIQELKIECTKTNTWYCDGRGNITETYFDQDKFAELLIRECATVSDAHEYWKGLCSHKILSHFEVENV